jgi:Protein of unknown function with HXXEE motif
MLNRLFDNWVYGGFLAGLLLLVLGPLFVVAWPAHLIAVFLCLPAYMIHQYEEHDNDRFRAYANRVIGKGHEVLTKRAVFFTNIVGVWGVLAAALWLAAFKSGYGLIAAYLLLLNGVIHTVPAILTRRYNPGLATAVIVFLPLGFYCLIAIQRAGGGSAMMHAVGILVAIGAHAAIAIPVIRNRRSYVGV